MDVLLTCTAHIFCNFSDFFFVINCIARDANRNFDTMKNRFVLHVLSYRYFISVRSLRGLCRGLDLCPVFYGSSRSLLQESMLLSTNAVCCFGHYDRLRTTKGGACNAKVRNLCLESGHNRHCRLVCGAHV